MKLLWGNIFHRLDTWPSHNGEKMTQYGRTKHCWDKRTQCFLREERSRCVICAEYTSGPRWFRMCCSQHFMKLLIFLLRQQLTKLSGLSREFGEFLPPHHPLAVVDCRWRGCYDLWLKFGSVVTLDDNDVIMWTEPPAPPTVTDFLI